MPADDAASSVWPKLAKLAKTERPHLRFPPWGRGLLRARLELLVALLHLLHRVLPLRDEALPVRVELAEPWIEIKY